MISTRYTVRITWGSTYIVTQVFGWPLRGGCGRGCNLFFFSLVTACPQFWITLLARPFGGSKTLDLYSG